ncbi:hypothetical protein K8P10_002979 [Leucobacter sp. Psy1]|nr:hypothetical protein K8P10_002979 [Leucobacter sp. Psy1]
MQGFAQLGNLTGIATDEVRFEELERAGDEALARESAADPHLASIGVDRYQGVDHVIWLQLVCPPALGRRSSESAGVDSGDLHRCPSFSAGVRW